MRFLIKTLIAQLKLGGLPPKQLAESLKITGFFTQKRNKLLKTRLLAAEYFIKKMLVLWGILILFGGVSFAGDMCKGRMMTPANICWDCIYPITFGHTTVISGRLPDTPNPTGTLCHCGTFPHIKFGAKIGFWEPFALVDVTREPYCMVNLGGHTLPLYKKWAVRGDESTSNPSQPMSFYNVHIYNYPLFQWIPVIPDRGCVAHGGFSITYLSELDPTWSDDKLAKLVHPETRAFANVAAQTACLADSVASNTHLPIDSLYYCAGSQGSIYPLTGSVAYHESGLQASVLLTERAGFLIHLYGRWRGTKGNRALCHPYWMPIMQKSGYRYQLAYPSRKSCEPFGRSTIGWGAKVKKPLSSENYSYVIWRKRNCCLGAH